MPDSSDPAVSYPSAPQLPVVLPTADASAQVSAMLAHLDEARATLETPADKAYENRLAQVRLGIASSLFTALRCKHSGTAAHSIRVALGCSSWAMALELHEADRDEIEVAALLHDIGKIGVPDSILLKPGKLTPDEAVVMDRYRQMGIEILRSCCATQGVLDIVQHAPAWFDGSRLNSGQSHDGLPLGARIVAIVDAFDSMTTDHVYRPAMSRERAIHELFQFAGTQFDLRLVKLFAAVHESDQQKLDKQIARRWLQALDPDKANRLWRLTEIAPQIGDGTPEDLFQRKLLENMRDAVVFLNRNLQIVMWNRGVARLTGISGESIYQRLFQPSVIDMRDDKGMTVTEEDCPVAYALRAGVQSLRRLIITGRNGKAVAVDAHTVPVVSSDGVTHGATLVLHDASPEASLEERCQSLHEKAIKDPLTQLANRAEFDRVLAQFVEAHLQRQLPCSMIICDIDRFKLVNDTYGHPAGDEVIKSFAQLLKSSCRPGDLCARYGGEEFVLLCADCNNAAAAQRADQTRKMFADFPQPMLGGKCISASFGVTEIQPGDTPETMLRRADRALLGAKEMGRNMVVQLGSGISEAPKEARRSWWSWKGPTPDQLLDKHLVTSVPLSVAVEKLRGFVADHSAEITLIEGNLIHLAIDEDSKFLMRRSSDRAVPFLIELNFSEEQTKVARSGTGTRTRIHVIIRPKKNRDRRRDDATQRARTLLASVRSYLMAAELSDEEESVIRKATSMLSPWRAKKEAEGDAPSA